MPSKVGTQVEIPALPALPTFPGEGQELVEDPITGEPMKMDKWQSFSWGWTWLSMGSFVLAQVILGAITGIFLIAHTTMHFRFMLESVTNFAAYYFGGLVIGAMSPRVRVTEPAVGAVLCMLLTMSVGMWTPISYLPFPLLKTILMCAVAFAIAWAGAVHGEKFTRQL